MIASFNHEATTCTMLSRCNACRPEVRMLAVAAGTNELEAPDFGAARH